MELRNGLATETGWEFFEGALDPDQIATTGSSFMIGNGYLGYRGTLAEWGPDELVGCIVADTWDTASEGALTELCNVPNGLFLAASVDGVPVPVSGTHDFERRVDLRSGLFSRRSGWRGEGGVPVSLVEERFASMDDVRLVVSRTRVTAHAPCALTIVTGIDGNVWSLSGEHFATRESYEQDGLVGIDLTTVELGTRISVVEGCRVSGVEPRSAHVRTGGNRILREFGFSLAAGDEVVVEKAVSIHHDNDVAQPGEESAAAAAAALADGYDHLFARHARRWEDVWAASDIEVIGDLESQVLTRFSLFHNIIHTPSHARLPIGARGLSSQVYQGAAFWDQEIFNLPMLTYTRPDLARNVLMYRHDTLPGACRKAARLGYRGAYYAWASGKTGDELFPDIFFPDVLTGRAMRNHFNCWQIHVSPDIVYALWRYYEATGDWSFIVEGGAEIAFEVADFLVSRAHFKKDKNRFELIRLLGPDEYHENVDNNAYTMYLAQYALEKAVEIHDAMSERAPAELSALLGRLGLDEDDVADWREHADLMYLPEPDPRTKLIEQFDGYFSLEDVTPDVVRQRLIDPDEYWGWPNGVAVRTQVLKQADVLQLFALIDIFPPEVMRANYLYYEPRTEHGSSLSPSAHALIASKAELPEEAFRYFEEASSIDLYNQSKKVMSGGSFLGGIHTAACGAVWFVVVQGFAGFEVHGDVLRFRPALPERWEGLRFPLVFRSNHLAVELRRDAITVTAAPDNPGTVTIRVGDDERQVAPGESASLG